LPGAGPQLRRPSALQFAIGAAAGGIGGAGVGGTYNYTKSKEGYDRAFSACMSGRGYTVR